jgi:hypothetical protein
MMIVSRRYLFPIWALIGAINITIKVATATTKAKPNVTIVALWASEGDYNYGMYTDMLINYWAEHLAEREMNDPTWPFHTSVELYDYKSDTDVLENYLQTRLNSSLGHPPVSVVLAPEGNLGYDYGYIATKFQIPYITTSSNPDPVTTGLPPGLASAFFIEAPSMYTFRSFIDTYVTTGVKSLATVSYSDDNDAGYNYWSCFGAAEYLGVPRGIKHVKHYDVYRNSTKEDTLRIANELKKLDPDAVLWCDWQSCTYSDTNATDRFSMTAMKGADYMPKAMGFLDCYYQNTTARFIKQGLVDYVGQPSFTHQDLRGQEYTEDDNPYANVFRPRQKVRACVRLSAC